MDYNKAFEDAGLDFIKVSLNPFKLELDEEKRDLYALNKLNSKYNTDFKSLYAAQIFETEYVAPQIISEYFGELFKEEKKEEIIHSFEGFLKYNLKRFAKGGVFHLTNDNDILLKRLSKYFKQAPLQTHGLFIYGNTGSGKTTIMKAIQSTVNEYYKRKYWFADIDVNSLIRRYKHNPDEALNFIHGKNLYIDDLGIEPKAVTIYGDNIDVMSEIILERYNCWISSSEISFFTTNLTLEEARERYGDRVYSRLMEMTNQLSLVGKSFRTLNFKSN